MPKNTRRVKQSKQIRRHTRRIRRVGGAGPSFLQPNNPYVRAAKAAAMQAVAIKEDVLQYKNIAVRNNADITKAVGNYKQPYVAAAIITKLNELKNVLEYTQTAVQLVKERADEAEVAAIAESAAKLEAGKADTASKDVQATAEVVYEILRGLQGKLAKVSDTNIVKILGEIGNELDTNKKPTLREQLAAAREDNSGSDSNNNSNSKTRSNTNSSRRSSVISDMSNIDREIPEFIKKFVDNQVVVYTGLSRPTDIQQTVENITSLMQAHVINTVHKNLDDYHIKELREIDLPESYTDFVTNQIKDDTANQQALYTYLMYVYILAIRDSVVAENTDTDNNGINAKVTANYQ